MEYTLHRYDLSKDKSLRPYSAADEYLHSYFTENDFSNKHVGIYHDRFGYLTCHLRNANPIVVCTQKSQEVAISKNLVNNELSPVRCYSPIDPIFNSTVDNKLQIVLLKVPKSLALFKLYLRHVVENSTEEIEVVCGFMTRHFTSNLLTIASQYFESVEQSRARKKARLLILKSPKTPPPKPVIDRITFNNEEYQQYWGVFSANHIDYATQFLLEHLTIDQNATRILDLASGNGVIARHIQKANPNAEIHLLDDSFLAVASAKLNVNGSNIVHHYGNDLYEFENNHFDVIVTNPPFHFEYEINIDVPLHLFQDAWRCLVPFGKLIIVANRHLNYSSHLKKYFTKVETIAENKKFLVYLCVKGGE